MKSLRRLVLPVVLLALCAGSAHADTVNLAWDASPAADLAGYRLYRSIQSGLYGAPISTLGSVTTTTVPAPNLTTDTTYFFTVTAFDLAGNESPKSNEVSKLVLAQAMPPAPTGTATITTPATEGMVFPVGPLLAVASTGPTGTTRNLYVDIVNDARPRALIPPQFNSVLTTGVFADVQGGTFPADCTTCPYTLIVEYVDSAGAVVASAQRTYTLGTATPPPPPVDTDGDGMPDSIDQCPTQAGPASNNGCPVVAPPPPPPPPAVDGVKLVTDTNRQVVINIGACPLKATGATGVTTSRSGSGANRVVTITCTTLP